MKCVKKVTSVSRIAVSELTSLIRINEYACKVPESLNWQAIPIKVPAAIVVSTQIDGKNLTHSAKLTFQCLEKWKDMQRCAYRVGFADGGYMLVGDKERPYPTAEVVQDISGDNRSSQLEEVTISYLSHRAIALLV